MEDNKAEYLESLIQENEIEDAERDYQTRAELVSHLIQEGDVDSAQVWIDDTLNLEDDCEWAMIKEFHEPIIDHLIDVGHIKKAQPLILHANKHFPDEDRINRMTHRAEKALTEQLSASVFPPSLSVSEWWDGPHLLQNHHLNEWIPGQIVDIDEGIATIRVAALDEYNTFEESKWEMPTNNLEDLSHNDPPDGEYLYSRLEIGIYSDNSVEIRFHEED